MTQSTLSNTPLTLTRIDSGDVSILRLSGDLDGQHMADAKTTLANLFGEGRKKILFDLGKVAYIDSSGLGFFIGALKKAREVKGCVKLLGLNAYMLGIFRLINLDRILDIYDDEKAALASFGTSSSASAS